MATGRMASNAPARGALRQRLAHSRPVSLLHKLTGGDRFRQSHAACQTQVKSPASHHSHLLSPGHLINHVIRAIPGHRSYLREIWLSPEDFKVLYATRDIACEGKRKVAWGAGGRHRPAQALVQGAGGAETGRPPRVPRGPPGFSLQTRLGPNVRRPARPPPRQCMRPATYPRCLHLLRALGFISLNGKENERVTDTSTEPGAAHRRRPGQAHAAHRRHPGQAHAAAGAAPTAEHVASAASTAAQAAGSALAPEPSLEEGTFRTHRLYFLCQQSVCPTVKCFCLEHSF